MKFKLIITMLICSVLLLCFWGCRLSNATAPTEPFASTQPTNPTELTNDSTEPTNESTEPSSEAIEPTETVCPRTIEYFKSHLTPYMTGDEAREVFGRKDTDNSNLTEHLESVWYLEGGYFLVVEFYPTMDNDMDNYLSTRPMDETNPDGTPIDDLYYYFEWYDHMEAYRAILYKGSTTGKREQVEIWFDYGYGPFWQEE